MHNTSDIQVFFDGNCPLCRREIDFLARRDRDGRIEFTDIAASEFSAADYGITMDDFMAQIRGRLPDGRFITGVEVFRRLYTAVGFGWLVRLTRTPGISWLLDKGYERFAKNRLRLTGRCEDGVCQVPTVHAPEEQPSAA